MSAMKFFYSLPLLLALAACSPSEPTNTPAATSTPKAASTVEYTAITAASMASAASDVAASNVAASDISASAPVPHLGGELSTQNQAKWQSYTCEENQKIDVRYYQSDAGSTAQIRHKGLNISAPYSPELSDEDLSAFSNGELTWTISNFVQTDFYQESDGFLVRHEKVEGAGEEGIVDHLLAQGCMPAK
ncbi:hypothetical protein GJU80_03850 [Neisseria brasiliensis]|uniref:C-type lysozyme inhibitor domain-containing protein n=1 Tax=Neisseria brasiliensis TaxID=2666100 RepID=A0A7X2GXF2_9NEIS|nr:hypothetical protein [Neisseria brasiliensis]MRN37645.1 hypothetical protein [Neisseria brasiliensis]